MANLAWTCLSVAVGACWLKRRDTWSGAGFFVLALLGAPVWVAFAVKGKTYAFAGLCVLIGTVALLSKQRLAIRWLLFAGAAALGVGSRYPVAGFFLPAGIGLLVLTRGWRARLAAVALMAFCAAVELHLAAAGNWPNFIFWTAGFHREVQFQQSSFHRFGDALRYAPAVWVICLYGFARAARARRSSEWIAAGSLLAGAVATLGGSAAFAEYVMPLIPAAALVGAPFVADRAVRLPVGALVGLLAVVVFAGWNLPPALTKDIALQSTEAAAFLRDHTPPDSVAVGTMAEIAVAAGLRIPPVAAMSKYGVSEDFPSEVARKRHLLTPAAVCDFLHDQSTEAVVLSMTATWNYSTSVPSYRALSSQAQSKIISVLKQQYRVAFSNESYVVLLRRLEAISGKPSAISDQLETRNPEPGTKREELSKDGGSGVPAPDSKIALTADH